MSATKHQDTKSTITGHVARVWTIPPVAQYDATTCWEACGHMAFLWRHRKDNAPQKGYGKAAGSYAKDYQPKSMEQLADFCGKLGMKMAKVANTNTVEHLLQQSPLVIWKQGHHISHIMLLTGFSDSRWYYIDPQVKNTGDSTQHTFGEHSYYADGHSSTNTVITAKGVKMNSQQASWHATHLHQPKDQLFQHLRKAVFGYFDPAKATSGKATHV
jgi:hypothetical protein